MLIGGVGHNGTLTKPFLNLHLKRVFAWPVLHDCIALLANCTTCRYLDGDSSVEIIAMLSDMLLSAVDDAADDPQDAQEAAEGIIDAMSEPGGCFALATAGKFCASVQSRSVLADAVL